MSLGIEAPLLDSFDLQGLVPEGHLRIAQGFNPGFNLGFDVVRTTSPEGTTEGQVAIQPSLRDSILSIVPG
jgi:hypothetical protein